MSFWKRLVSGRAGGVLKKTRPDSAEDSSRFVDECFIYSFEAVPDKRTASDFVEVDEIDRLANGQDYTAALVLVHDCLAKHPDFYVFHMRRAQIYNTIGDAAKEKEALLDALQKSRRKYYACDSLAQRAFEEGNDHDAVLWWVRACDLQVRIREMRYPRCFISLGYVAAGLGDAASEQWLRECADRTPTSIDLTAESAQRHHQIGLRARSTGYDDSFRTALRQLRHRSVASG